MYFELFKTFFKMGAFTFGGGYAMLPLLKKEVVENKGWATDEELIDYYAIGQCTPGIIAVNTSTFIGRKVAGVAGAIVATLGFIAPSFIIISLIAGAISNFSHNETIAHAFAGVRIAVCALVVKAVYTMAKKGVVDVITLAILISAFIAVGIFKITPIVVVIASCIIGIISQKEA